MLLWDYQGMVVLEAAAPSQIVLRTQKTSIECDATAEMIAAWQKVRDLCSYGVRERAGLEVDPNESVHDVTLAFAEPAKEERFMIGYLRGEENLLEAAVAVDSIFEECGVDRRLQFIIVALSRPQRPQGNPAENAPQMDGE